MADRAGRSKIGVLVARTVGGVPVEVDMVELEASLGTLSRKPAALGQCPDPMDPRIDGAIAKFALDNALDAVVLAAGSERVLGARIGIAARGMPLERVAPVNLLDHCARVHADPAARVTKARSLVAMAMARVAYTLDARREKLSMSGRVLVMGAGPAGLGAALELSGLGHEVVLVEARERVAAIVVPAIADMAARARERSAIELLPMSHVVEVTGRPGAFLVRIGAPDGRIVEREVGAVVVATGVEHPEPAAGGAIAGLGKLESMLHHGGKDLPSSVGLNADPDEVGEVSAQRAIGYARVVREKHLRPASVFHRNVPVRSQDGQAEYEKALEVGVAFYRTDAGGTKAKLDGGSVVVTGFDSVLRRPFEVRCDMYATGAQAVPGASTSGAARILGLEIEDGACLDPGNVTFRGGRSAREGVFVAGACGAHEEYEDSMRSGRIAALEAHALLARGEAEIAAEDVAIEKAKCAACLTCVRLCPWSAASVRADLHTPVISDLDCKDCGLCAAACPQGAITHATLPQQGIVAIGEAAVGAAQTAGSATTPGRETVVALACSRSGWAAADEAGALGLELPRDVNIVHVGCAGIVGEQALLGLIACGVDRVLVLGCPEGNCANRRGSIAAKRRVELCRGILRAVGEDPERIAFAAVASNMPHELARVLGQAACGGGKVEGEGTGTVET